MKIETAKLEGAALDWAVAKCEGRPWPDNATKFLGVQYFGPSTNWAQGGPIIERERIDIWCYESDLSLFRANIQGSMKPDQQARTMLLAAMRCYIASKLGAVVEVPDELVR